MGPSDTFIPSREEQIAMYRDRRRRSESPYGRWLMLIKEIRLTHECSILDAERIALSNPHRRRWVEQSINRHQECRKMALAHIRHNPGEALIEREGDTFVFRIPAQ